MHVDVVSIYLYGCSEKLQSIPEQLDARIAEKHFLLAVDLLQDALRSIRRSDMENIGALTDLRIYFSNQETVRLASRYKVGDGAHARYSR